MLNNLKGPLCTKAYQRRAAAYRALQQYGRAVTDLEAAVSNDEDNKELQGLLSDARRELEEHKKQNMLKKAMSKSSSPVETVSSSKSSVESKELLEVGQGQREAADDSKSAVLSTSHLDIEKLRTVEKLVQEVQRSLEPDALLSPPSESEADTSGSGKGAAGPNLPARPKANTTAQKSPKTKPSASQPEKQVDALTRVCGELSALVRDDDLASVYFRECGGLKAAGRVSHIIVIVTSCVIGADHRNE